MTHLEIPPPTLGSAWRVSPPRACAHSMTRSGARSTYAQRPRCRPASKRYQSSSTNITSSRSVMTAPRNGRRELRLAKKESTARPPTSLAVGAEEDAVVVATHKMPTGALHGKETKLGLCSTFNRTKAVGAKTMGKIPKRKWRAPM